MSAEKLHLLREMTLDRAMMGWPARVYSFLLPDLDLLEFREVKRLLVVRKLQVDEANARRILQFLVRRGYLELESRAGAPHRYRLIASSTEEAA